MHMCVVVPLACLPVCVSFTWYDSLFLFPYWAVQAGLLTPLTFTRHRLSPLAALLLVHTFFTTEGGETEFANFTLPTSKKFLEACSQNVSGNKIILRKL